MSTLRDLTAEAHKKAENTAFMRLLFAKAINEKEYQDYVTQSTLIYAALEPAAERIGLLTKFPGIARLPNIRKDLAELNAKTGTQSRILWETMSYYNEIIKMTDPAAITAHFYVRYAGDMFGGQILKTIVPGPVRWFDFEGNLPALRQTMREISVPELAVDANNAFRSTTYILDNLISNE